MIIAETASPGRAQSTHKAFDLMEWNGGKFIYGVDYYPEAWDEARWEKDAVMMQAAGINFVRLAEFSWVKTEPEAGHFDFAWLDRALKVLNAHGIKAVLGTPTASPPAWLMAKYPDIAAMDEDGVRYRYGSRDNRCLNSPHYLDATRRIVTAMAEHYKNHPGVIGWQIDNELGGPYCYDPYCLAAFQKWCHVKYSTLESLNKAWGTVFWGHTYTAWSEIPLPWNTLEKVSNPSLQLDYDRYFSDLTRDYLKLQVDILRKIAPGKAITHNEMGMFDQVDYSELNGPLDFVSWDNYPMFGEDYSSYTGAALAHDLMRGSKRDQNFMVMEEQAGLPGWTVFWGRQAASGLYRVWSYQAIAHGADGVCYFRWRTSRYGTEQYWQGILDQDSLPNARYQVVARMGKELEQLHDLLHGSTVVSPAGLLISPDTRWAFHIQPLVKDFDYNRQLHHFYDPLRQAGISVDVLFPESDFSRYKLIVAPSLFVVTRALAAKLTNYVRSGGTLILSYRSGVKDEHNVVTDETLPGPLRELAGVAIHDYDPHTNQAQEVTVGGDIPGLEASRRNEETAGGPAHQIPALPGGATGVRFPASVWFDVLDPTTAQVLATYGKGYYAGKAAVTENNFGSGRVFYVGTESTSPLFYSRLLAQALRPTGIAAGPRLPEGVEFAVREKEGTKIIFLLNYTDKPHTVFLGERYRNALTGDSERQGVEVAPFDVKVLTSITASQ
jgi:beta-galactosidase